MFVFIFLFCLGLQFCYSISCLILDFILSYPCSYDIFFFQIVCKYTIWILTRCSSSVIPSIFLIPFSAHAALSWHTDLSSICLWKLLLQKNPAFRYIVYSYKHKRMICWSWVHRLGVNAWYHSGGGTWTSSFIIIVISLLLVMNLTLWCKLYGIVPAECIPGCSRSRLKTAGMSASRKNTSNSHGPINTFRSISTQVEVFVPSNAWTIMPFGRISTNLTETHGRANI